VDLERVCVYINDYGVYWCLGWAAKACFRIRRFKEKRAGTSEKKAKKIEMVILEAFSWYQ